MWDRKDTTYWWTSLVLTNNNPDSSSPKFSRNKAEQIFTILSERNLIIPTIETINETSFPTYKINVNKVDEWYKLINKKGFSKLYILPTLKIFFKHSWLLILWFVTLILASTVQALCKNIIDHLFK